MAHRYRAAAYACAGYEEVTEAGYIRRLSVEGSEADISALTAVFRQSGISETMWSETEGGTELRVHGSLLYSVDFERFRLTASYFEAELMPGRSSKTVGTLILNGTEKVFVNRVQRGRAELFSLEDLKGNEWELIEFGFPRNCLNSWSGRVC